MAETDRRRTARRNRALASDAATSTVVQTSNLAESALKRSIELGCEPEVFLRTYWQKQPTLMRSALPNFQCPITANDLAGLSMEAQAASRLVIGTGQRFKVEHGPFLESRFASLGKKNWTLLVQAVDQFDPDVRDLLSLFSFLPNWRIEDVMVSYAVAGGSVGAHVDQYDVFLLQARGARRWQIDDRISARSAGAHAFIEGAPLKLLRQFKPNVDQVLQPGDMLYLPPGVPHHGIALDDDCMTFSIGLRAPSVAEMLKDLLACELIPEQLRYADADLSMQEAGPTLSKESVRRVRIALHSAIALPDQALGAWFAGYSSRYRAPALPSMQPNTHAKRRQRLIEKLSRHYVLSKHPALRTIVFERDLLIGGCALRVCKRLRELLSKSDAHLTQADFEKLPASDQIWVETLLSHGALQWTNAASHKKRSCQELT
jgi:50S ribosomal protein L16 3-hydroxylase